jgi:hypothetical protein
MTPQFSIEELRNFDRHHAPKYAEAVKKAREARGKCLLEKRKWKLWGICLCVLACILTPFADWTSEHRLYSIILLPILGFYGLVLSLFFSSCLTSLGCWLFSYKMTDEHFSQAIEYLSWFMLAIGFCFSFDGLFKTALIVWGGIIGVWFIWHSFIINEVQVYRESITEGLTQIMELHERFLTTTILSQLKKIPGYRWQTYISTISTYSFNIKVSMVSLSPTQPLIEIHEVTFPSVFSLLLTGSEFKKLIRHPSLRNIATDRWIIKRWKDVSITGAELLKRENQQQEQLQEEGVFGKLKQQESKSYNKAEVSPLQTKRPIDFGRTSSTQNDFLLNNQKGDTPQKQNSDEGLKHTRKVMRHFEQSFKKAHGLLAAEQEEDTNQTDTSQLVSKTSADKLKQQESQSSLKAVVDEHPPKVLTRLLGNETKIYSGIQNADDFLVSETEESSDVTQPSYQQQEIFIDNDSFEVKRSYALPVVTPFNSSIATDNLEEELNNTLNEMSHVEESSSKSDDLLEIEQEQDNNQADTSQLVSKPSTPSKRLKVRSTTQRKRLQGNTANSTQPRLSPQVPTTQPPKKETDFPTPAPYVMRKTIELIAMEAVMAYEKAQGRFPEDVSTQNLGYDIDSGNETEERLIEVKGIATIANPVITENEYRHLTSNPNAYLYIVQQCNTENPQLYIHHQLGEHHFEAKITKYEIAYADLKREVDAQCNLF